MKSSYQVEQLEALSRVRLHLASRPRGEKEKLCALAADYLAFRRRVDDFQDRMIENYFIAAGCSSSLMYLHNSPGLLRVKRQAGI